MKNLSEQSFMKVCLSHYLARCSAYFVLDPVAKIVGLSRTSLPFIILLLRLRK